MTTRQEHVDVVIVGGGAAGLAAAIEAAEGAGRVVLLERAEQLGGTTAWAIGSVTASRTRQQRRNGIEDDVDEHAEDMARFAGDFVHRDNVELRRLLVEHSGSTLAWLERKGLVFLGPMEEPPHRRARMYNVLPGSRAYIHRLGRVARELGVRVLTSTEATAVVRDDERIVGVDCETPDGQLRFTAARGVVLAAGDFSGSAELKRRYIGPLAAQTAAVNAGSTGGGIALGLQAGGHVCNGDLALGPEIRFVAPARQLWVQRVPPFRWLALAMKLGAQVLPGRLMRRVILSFATTYLAPAPRIFDHGAFLVGTDGTRVGDELGEPWNDLAARDDATAYIVFDARVARELDTAPNYISTAPGVAYAYLRDYRSSRKDLYHEAPTLEDLARAIGVPAPALLDAIRDGNEQRDPGRGCEVGPFVALGPVRSWIVLTEGGLAIDTACRVLDERGDPIPGLFAAGSNGQGGLLLEGHGNHLGWAFTSGRIAGREAVRQPREGAHA